MSAADDPAASSSPPVRQRAEDALPPVEAPTASFLLQLFFIPMLIVGIIVLVWFSIAGLAHLGQDIETTISKLEKNPTNDWPTLYAVTMLLRDPQQAALRHNVGYAERAAKGLTLRLDAAERGDLQDIDSIKFRASYARFLGEHFAVPEVIPAVLRAATQSKGDSEIRVRISALEGLSALASQLGPDELRARPDVQQAIEKALAERGDPLREQLRERAAFLLGVLGGDKERDRLAQLMTDDPAPNVRYNAALGLARDGDPRAVPELVRMLDPANEEVIANEKHADQIAWKRQTVQLNAIAGAKQFIAKNPAADRIPLRDALTKLRAAGVPGAVDASAAELLHRLNEPK